MLNPLCRNQLPLRLEECLASAKAAEQRVVVSRELARRRSGLVVPFSSCSLQFFLLLMIKKKYIYINFAKQCHSCSPTSTTRIFIEYCSNVTFKASICCVSQSYAALIVIGSRGSLLNTCEYCPRHGKHLSNSSHSEKRQQ